MPIDIPSIEKAIADVLWKEYQALRSRGERKKYLAELNRAARELGKLSRGQDVNYNLPRIPEAYAMWYHMQRLDNVVSVFKKYEDIMQGHQCAECDVESFRSYLVDTNGHEWPSQGKLRYLDIGSGTGSSSVAPWCWAHGRQRQGKPALNEYVIYQVEHVQSMYELSRCLFRVTCDVLQSQGEGINIQYQTKKCKIGNWMKLRPCKNGGYFDMIMFCYTFSSQDTVQVERTCEAVSRVATWLRPGGLLYIIAPNSDKLELGNKQRLCGEIVTRLARDGMRWVQFNLEPWDSVAVKQLGDKCQRHMRELWACFSEEAHDLEVYFDPRIPYYGNRCGCYVLTR